MTVAQLINYLSCQKQDLVVRVSLETAQVDFNPKDHVRTFANLLIIG